MNKLYYKKGSLQRLKMDFSMNIIKYTLNHGFSSNLNCNWCLELFVKDMEMYKKNV